MLEGLLALPIRKPLEPGEWRRFEKIWGPRQSDQTTVEFGPARAVLGEYVAAAAPQDIKATFDVPSKGSCIPSFRFSYIEAKGLRGRLGVDAKAQANLPDV